MQLILGIVVVIACTLGGYMAHGGNVAVLWQPFEVIIIVGSAVGAYIIANEKKTLKKTGSAIKMASKGARYKKDDFIELLCMMYQVFKLAKTKGLLSLEKHIEAPHESTLFSQFPKFQHDHHAIEFFCDYLRMISLGADKPYEMEALMDAEIEVHHHEELKVGDALQTLADGMPALGIVAAVLGVINTMGAIDQPPAILGKLIGAALVGTFLGVWISYGYISPIASKVKVIVDADGKYFQCMKTGLLAHLAGSAPAISIEFARKALSPDVRPTFTELEEATSQLPPPA